MMFPLWFFIEVQWTVIPNVKCYKYLIWIRKMLLFDFFSSTGNQLVNNLPFLAKWSRDISRDLSTQYISSRISFDNVIANRPFAFNSFFRPKPISKVAIVKTKSAIIACFSSPPFLLLALSFSPFLFLRYYDFGASWAYETCLLTLFHSNDCKFP